MADNFLFSIVPIEAFMDDRLSKTELRVLGAILSFRNKNTNLCWPSRKQIEDRCGLSSSKISTATTGLVNHGWLKKEGNGGRSRHCSYSLTVPDIKTVPDSGTVPKKETVPDSGLKTVPDSGTGIKQTIEQTIEREVNQSDENLSPSISWNRRKTDRFGSEYQSSKKQTKTPFPVGKFKITEEMFEYGNRKGLSDDYIRHETGKLKNKALADGLLKEDWYAFWYFWIDKASEFLKQGACR